MSQHWHPARQMGTVTVKEGVRTQTASRDGSRGGEAREGKAASWLLWPQASDPDPGPASATHLG